MVVDETVQEAFVGPAQVPFVQEYCSEPVYPGAVLVIVVGWPLGVVTFTFAEHPAPHERVPE